MTAFNPCLWFVFWGIRSPDQRPPICSEVLFCLHQQHPIAPLRSSPSQFEHLARLQAPTKVNSVVDLFYLNCYLVEMPVILNRVPFAAHSCTAAREWCVSSVPRCELYLQQSPVVVLIPRSSLGDLQKQLPKNYKVPNYKFVPFQPFLWCAPNAERSLLLCYQRWTAAWHWALVLLLVLTAELCILRSCAQESPPADEHLTRAHRYCLRWLLRLCEAN